MVLTLRAQYRRAHTINIIYNLTFYSAYLSLVFVLTPLIMPVKVLSSSPHVPTLVHREENSTHSFEILEEGWGGSLHPQSLFAGPSLQEELEFLQPRGLQNGRVWEQSWARVEGKWPVFERRLFLAFQGVDRAEQTRQVPALSNSWSAWASAELSRRQPLKAQLSANTGEQEKALSGPQVLATFSAINKNPTMINIWIFSLF